MRLPSGPWVQRTLADHSQEDVAERPAFRPVPQGVERGTGNRSPRLFGVIQYLARRVEDGRDSDDDPITMPIC